MRTSSHLYLHPHRAHVSQPSDARHRIQWNTHTLKDSDLSSNGNTRERTARRPAAPTQEESAQERHGTAPPIPLSSHKFRHHTQHATADVDALLGERHCSTSVHCRGVSSSGEQASRRRRQAAFGLRLRVARLKPAHAGARIRARHALSGAAIIGVKQAVQT